jgi:pimeloyl-ACP methyl ester carboxylesterase
MKFIDEIDVGFDDVGNGQPIVLLHGYPFNRTMWQDQIKELSNKYRVICPDLRGHGQTSISGEISEMREMAKDTAKLLDHLGINQIILGGLSMGGYVVFEFYRQFPERVKALVLADTKPGADTEEARHKRFESAEKAIKEGMSAIADEMLPKVLSEETRADKPEIVNQVREMIESTSAAGAVAALRGMAARSDQTDLLANINAPTLIIVGDEDALTPPQEAEKMHQAIKNSQIVRIKNAAHLTPLEKPEEFDHALFDFFNSLNF